MRVLSFIVVSCCASMPRFDQEQIVILQVSVTMKSFLELAIFEISVISTDVVCCSFGI